MNEIKIRNQWLFMWGLSGLMGLINAFLSVWSNPVFQVEPQSIRYWAMAASVLTLFGLLAIGYHCAYRKPGTKLLTFFLVFTALNFGINLVLYFSGKLSIPPYIPYYKAYVCVGQITGVLWLIACWRMRRVNQRRQLISREPV